MKRHTGAIVVLLIASLSPRLAAGQAEASGKQAAEAAPEAFAQQSGSDASGELPVIPVSDAPYSDATPENPEGGAAVHLEEIVVTATKREKSSREIPVSVDAYDAEKLSERGAQSAQDALLLSPGTSVNNYYSPNVTAVQIRGATVNTVNTLGASPTAAFFDDISLASPSVYGNNPNIDIFDLQTVEILKGPQGTLFGGTALAGALRSVPASPELNAFRGKGFYSHVDVEESEGTGMDYGIMLNVPIGETFALRGMGVRRNYPGAIDNTRDGVKDTDSYKSQQYRVAARWEPISDMSFGVVLHKTSGSTRDSAVTDNPNRLERSNESGFSPNEWNYRILQIKGEYSFEAFSLVAAASQVRKHDSLLQQEDRLAAQTPLINLTVPGLLDADIRTAELRAVSVGRSESSFWLLREWEWLVGLFDYRADQGLFSTIRVGQGPIGIPLPNVDLITLTVDALAREQAMYFDLTRYLAEDHLEFNVGARLFKQENSGTNTSSSAQIPTQNVSRHTEERGINPKVALTWVVDRNLSFRTAAAKGFRFGGSNLAVDGDPNAPPFYKSDELWNYEVGMRSDWLDRKLRVDVTAFYIDWSRVQVTQLTYTSLSQYIANLGAAVSKGVEAQVRMFLPLGFSVDVSGAYTDSRTASEFESAGTTIPKHQRLPGTPFVTGAASIGYSTSLGRALFNSSLTWTYQGEAFNNLEHQRTIPAYYLFGLNFGLSLPDIPGSPTMSLNIVNLLDERTYNNVYILQRATDYFPVRPRTATLTVGFSF